MQVKRIHTGLRLSQLRRYGKGRSGSSAGLEFRLQRCAPTQRSKDVATGRVSKENGGFLGCPRGISNWKQTKSMSNRLQFVDSLRGLSALYVVLHHVFLELKESRCWDQIDPTLRFLTGWLEYGHLAVPAFLVISGFCLMMPVVRTGCQRLPGGVVDFLKRRALRILPPYYGALCLSLVLLVLFPELNQRSGHHWDCSLPAFTRGIIFSHLLLLHNLSPDWIYKIDHPLWSIAIEWQVYFVFAFVLMPAVRKTGIVGAVGIAFAIGLIPIVAFNTGQWTNPWLLGLFSIGMFGAVVSFSQQSVESTLRRKVPWGVFTMTFLVLILITGNHVILKELLTGLVIGSSLIWGVEISNTNSRSIGRGILILLTSAPLVLLGTFSYSLYLIHAPVVALTRIMLEHMFQQPATIEYVMLFGIAVPLSLAAGFFFFLLIERHFLPSANKSRLTT